MNFIRHESKLSDLKQRKRDDDAADLNDEARREVAEEQNEGGDDMDMQQ